MADGAENQREILTISILMTSDNPEALFSAEAMEKPKPNASCIVVLAFCLRMIIGCVLRESNPPRQFSNQPEKAAQA